MHHLARPFIQSPQRSSLVVRAGAHLVEIALWALVFALCGEFQDFATAFYHSAVNYTSQDYGDVIMSPT